MWTSSAGGLGLLSRPAVLPFLADESGTTQIEYWEEANPFILGEDLDQRLGLDSREAQDDFITQTGFTSIPRARRDLVLPSTRAPSPRSSRRVKGEGAREGEGESEGAREGEGEGEGASDRSPRGAGRVEGAGRIGLAGNPFPWAAGRVGGVGRVGGAGRVEGAVRRASLDESEAPIDVASLAAAAAGASGDRLIQNFQF
uniref:Uncharacterized protein n=1 Tax=Ananas comosus var. bracteatus TaxID=296719 RepID=A0A6V7QH46_ANACO|nr:unnamed protein product [Ananas comosus var. bracteatus]